MVSCYAFCKNFKRLLSQHLVKFSVSSQNLVMKSQNKSDTHVLRDETTLYLNQKGIIVAGVTSTSEWFWIKLAERPLHANKRMSIRQYEIWDLLNIPYLGYGKRHQILKWLTSQTAIHFSRNRLSSWGIDDWRMTIDFSHAFKKKNVVLTYCLQICFAIWSLICFISAFRKYLCFENLARNVLDVNFRPMSCSNIVSTIFIVNDPLQN